MKKLRYYFIIKYTISGLLFGLLLIISGAIINYYKGFDGSVFHLFKYSPDFEVLIISPLFLGLFLGFIGFRREQLVQLNQRIRDLLFKERLSHSETDQQLNLMAKVVSQVNEAIIISDENGHVQWVNGGFTKIHGYSIEEIKGENLVKKLCGPLTNMEIVSEIVHKLNNGEAVVEELLTYQKNGNTIWLSVSIKPIFNDDGKIINFIAIQNDITHRKERQFAVESLYKEVADYKFALDQSAIVMRFSVDGKIIYVNNKFCEINDLPKEELIGKDYRTVNISLRNKTIIKEIWKTLNNGKNWTGELINRNKNGKTYWADTTIVPLLDQNQKPIQFLTIQQDITERKLLENQLIINKNKLQEAMRIAGLGSWESDKDGVITISAELKQLYKLPLKNNISSAEIYKNIHEDDLDNLKRKMAEARDSLQTVEFGYRYIIDGKIHYMSSNITSKLNSSGEYMGSFGTVQDITESKLSALALRKSEEEKAVVLNNTQTIICLHDMNGVIRDINMAAEKISGFAKKEVIGLNLKSIISPESCDQFDEYIYTIKNSQTACGTMQIITKAGNKRVWLYQNTVYNNNIDEPYVIASAIDITESVKVRNEIEKQQQITRQIIDNSPNVIFVLNENRQIILANANFANYYPYYENTAPFAADLSTGPDDIFLGDIEGVFEMEDGQMIRWEGSQKNITNNNVSWFNIINKCFKEKNGKKYVLVYGMDITGRHKVETELIAANELVERALKVKDQFISNMSHEIRTPLNAVIGFTDLLAETTLDKEQTDYVDIVKTASANLLSLINNILDLSKIESRNLELENLPIDICKIVKDVVKILDSKAKNKGLTVNYFFDRMQDYTVMGDQLRLTQIMFNLLGNAIKFTDEGFIDINFHRIDGSEEGKDYIAFSIKDTGIGVPLDKQDEIFERFTQANTNTQRLYGGTGLGLNITKSIIDLYGGSLSIDSKSGKGTTFNFIIPFNRYIKSEDISNDVLKKTDDSLSIHVNKALHILLAEDNSINALLATQVLTRKGFTIEHVVNGELALEAVQKKYFDLILMDIQMPVMNGIQSAIAIRNLEFNTSPIPIIAMTAHSLQGEMQNCFNAGMNGYIAKPFKPDDLFNTIYQVIRERNKYTLGDSMN